MDPALSGLLLSPLVIAARLPILWFEAFDPDPGRRSETNRLVVEKMKATQEGIVAAQIALGSAMAETGAAMMLGRTPKGSPNSVAKAVVKAGLGPAARQVRKNHRRLSRG